MKIDGNAILRYIEIVKKSAIPLHLQLDEIAHKVREEMELEELAKSRESIND